jgi:hypothetical protein
MKSAEEIEQIIRELHVEADAEKRERTVRDLAEAHAERKNRTQALNLLSYGRAIMRQKPRRAAVIAAALLLAGLFSVGSGSVAFSQATRTVSWTLLRLKAMITGDRTNRPPEPERVPDPYARKIDYGVRLFGVRPSDQGIWQSLNDLGIEFVQVSAAPETYFAMVSRQQAKSVDDALWTLRFLASPAIQRPEGELAWIATRSYDSQEPNGTARTSGLAMGWLPTVSDDGTEIWSTVSFHDGLNGFEIPNVATEPGEVVLIRVKGMWSHSDDANTQEALPRAVVTAATKGMGTGSYSDDPNRQKESHRELLIRVKLDLWQTP